MHIFEPEIQLVFRACETVGSFNKIENKFLTFSKADEIFLLREPLSDPDVVMMSGSDALPAYVSSILDMDAN